MHGYELFQQIQADGIDTWFNVSMASVYYSLGKLREQGLVAESRQRGARSARKSIYRLTEEGRAAFFAAMEEQASSKDRTYLDYDLVIYLLNRLPVQRVTALLLERQAFLASEAEQIRATASSEREDGGSPLKLAILDHQRRFLDMELGWLADVICDVQGGSDEMAGAERPKPGLMLLSGDLRKHYLPDLLRLIASGKHSGRLTVNRGDVVRSLSFEEGQPVCAASLQRGEMGNLPLVPEEVLDGLNDLFRWQEGQFTFDQELGCQEWCMPLRCSVEDLVLSGCRCVDNWAIIQRLVPSADTIFEPAMRPEALDVLSLTPAEQQVLDAVDGVKEVATIARD
jgi:DNA-binding PadR family transcriptional regulator